MKHNNLLLNNLVGNLYKKLKDKFCSLVLTLSIVIILLVICQAQNRMTEILANGIGRKAQVAMRNKHGNSKNSHPVRPRHLDYLQDQHGGNKVTVTDVFQVSTT